MLRSTASKVMWVGRATVFLVGLAVILALIFGVASTALGANGNPFLLGKKNVASAISTLVKQGTGPALKLQVEAGQPPLAVNSTTRVANLNAATAGRADSAASADSATNATNADNADTVDGKNATDFAAAYKRTVVVSPTGTDAENGTALLNALNGITDASQTKPYLIHIEPGTYNLGSGTLQMQPYVDIEGSGELNTLITSSVSTVSGCTTGTVRGANNSELRFLTARNTGAGGCNGAIYNDSVSPRLTHVTAEAIGPQKNIGVYNNNSSPTITQSKLSGSAYSLAQQNGGTAKVAFTQLVGPVTKNLATLQCFNNYNENLAAVTCP